MLTVQEFALHRGPEGFDERIVDAGCDVASQAQQVSFAQAVPKDPRLRHPVGIQ